MLSYPVIFQVFAREYFSDFVNINLPPWKILAISITTFPYSLIKYLKNINQLNPVYEKAVCILIPFCP